MKLVMYQLHAHAYVLDDLGAPSLQLCDAGLAACYFCSQRAETIAALRFEALALLLLLIRLLRG